MAFNKGLQLNDGNTVVRDTIYLGSADKAFFQTKWASVDGVDQEIGRLCSLYDAA